MEPLEDLLMLKEGLALILIASTTGVCALAQSQGSNQGQPMGAPPQLDTSRMQEEMHHASAPAPGPLKIGFGAKTSEWTAERLSSLPHTTITVYNEHEKVNQTYSGVPLIDFLTPLGVSARPHGKEFRLYVVAAGADDYQVVYSIGEITPDVHDGTVLVADSVDGKSLGNKGLFQLVATGEKRPARWVRNLIAIHVLPAQ
jgi:hypothetical protein